jgi:GT2 family glycosyltransferase
MSDAPTLRHAVVIASMNRPEILRATLEGLAGQTHPADAVVLSVTDPADLPDDAGEFPGTVTLISPRGSTVQRNRGVSALGITPELVTFLDDDIELAPDYFEKMRAFMSGAPEVVLMTGLVVADGAAGGSEIPRDAARGLLREAEPSEFVREVRAVYGCNMTARGAVAALEPFDERMRLYAWQEDTDFSVRCARHGRVVHYWGCAAVHLAAGSGRVNGRVFGFVQNVNPFYLWSKGTKTLRELMHDWAVYVGANIVNFRDRSRPDRRGRLLGNVLGFKEVLLYGGRPEAVEIIARRRA